MSERDEFRDPYERERRQVRLPLKPKGFTGKRVQGGIELTVIERGRLYTENQLSGADHYNIYFARTVSQASQADIDAGFTRAKLIEGKPASRKEDHELTFFIAHPDYQKGWFYCTGGNVNGVESEPTEPLNFDETTNAGSMPDDVTHLQISESGEPHNGTTISVLAVSCIAPMSPSFYGVQLFLKDYPDIGTTMQGGFHRYTGSPGGTVTFDGRYSVSRRIGVGTVAATLGIATITGTGTNFLAQAQVGDWIEILGHRAEIQSRTATSITLTANWATPGQTVTGASFTILGKHRVYAVAISKDMSYREDVENSPYVDVLMDGELSAPNAPTVTGYSLGNLNRLEWAQVSGVGVMRYLVFRGLGSGTAFASCKQVGPPVDHDQNTLTANTNKTFDDTDFTLYDRETGQGFAYYVVTENIRGERSQPSTVTNVSCRLDSAADESPTVPSRGEARNLLFNPFIYGTNLGTVSTADAVQDNGTGAAPTGHFRWTQSTTGGATAPSHVNTTEVLLPAPGASAATMIKQKISAWGNATAAERRIDAGMYITFSMYARTGSGSPSGDLNILLDQYNGDPYGAGTRSGQCKYVTRISGTDALSETPSSFSYSGSQISTTMRRYYLTFHTDPTLTTTHLLLTIMHSGSTNGVGFYVTKVMLNPGEELAVWTADMGNTGIRFDPPTGGAPIPGRYLDKDGSRTYRIET